MSERGEVWTYSEDFGLMLELLGKGHELAIGLQTKLTAVLLGHNVKAQAGELIRYGAQKVLVVDSPQLKGFRAEPYLSALTQLVKQGEPELLLIGSTRRAKELAFRLAARLNVGCVPDCVNLRIDEQGRVLMDRIVYGGSAVATQTLRTKPQIVTVPPRRFEKLAYAVKREGEIVEVSGLQLDEPKIEVIDIKPIERAEVKIEEAKVVICGGRGLERKEDFKILYELAKVLGGYVGCTRPLAEDRKWFTEWVGLSGHKIKPDLYIACGISGVIQHVAGIRDSKVIVSINKDPEAPISEVADYIIVGNLYEVVPALTEAFKKLLT